MRGNRLAAELGFLALLCVNAASCGSDSNGNGGGGSGANGGSSGTGASAASSNSGGTLISVGKGNGNTSSVPDGSACAQVVSKGEAVPLDMYILLDKSASMRDATGAGPRKWDAISAALESFLNDPASKGLGVGLQYFPLLKPGVPETCTTHAQCGAGGPCFLTSCDNTGVITPCVTDSECSRGGRCIPFGICELEPAPQTPRFCSPIGVACPNRLGNCLDFAGRYCVNGTECAAGVYAKPAVAIAPLPNNAQPLMSSIDATMPEGRTPTAPALAGAVQEAGTWAKANLGHRVVAVLATDGLPTECMPTDINQVATFASDGVRAMPSISTFVIGVFGPEDAASQANLNTIASAGGTTKAFIVDTSGDVTKEFQDALKAIRGSALVACEFQVPPSSSGAMLDFGKVNLEVTHANGKKDQLVYVDGDAACAGAPGPAWHYDVAPASGTPQRIVVCPSACNTITAEGNAVVNLQIGCKDSIR